MGGEAVGHREVIDPAEIQNPSRLPGLLGHGDQGRGPGGQAGLYDFIFKP